MYLNVVTCVKIPVLKRADVTPTDVRRAFIHWLESRGLKLYFFLFALQEGTSKFASLESCAKEHQKRTHKRLQLQKEMVRQRLAN